uniref:Regulator of microtubule dynamics protein 3 n=1 Tax=Nothobranchius kadleci TaxID=1051664 RepID=A0A1A8DCM0_NOTKA
MSSPLGRSALIGLAVGATAGLGLIAFVIYREMSRRRSLLSENRYRPTARLINSPDGAAHVPEPQDVHGDEEEEEEDVVEGGGLQLQRGAEVPNGELALLLAQSDILHTGGASLKAEGFRLLLENRAEHQDNREFLWRLARAYADMYESTEDEQVKSRYAQKGREEAEEALQKNGLNADCHKWFAVLTALALEHGSMHSKLKSSHLLKEHLDQALALRDDDPMCYYLLGRWCYEVSSWDWLERKAAAALYRSPPTCTLHDALENFLKAEALSPGFSRTARLYVAKCHKQLGNTSEASSWTRLALEMPTSGHPGDEARKLEAELRLLADRQV